MKEFKYDVIQLIQSVKDRPCLWDRTQETYKDRFERRTAWEEVYAALDEDYHEMTPEEKRMLGEQVLYKWTNIRDTFMKSLKVKLGRPRRKYVFYKHLKFLIGNTDEYNTESPEETSYKVETETPKERKRTKKPKETKKKIYDYESNNESVTDLVAEVEEVTDPRLMNEDEAFFASLLPSVVKYNEDEKLEFRIEVLNVMRNIKEKKNWNKIEME